MFASTRPYKIIGGHVQLACDTAQPIVITGPSNAVLLQADVQNIRFKLSGVPTATSGFQLVAGAAAMILPLLNGHTFQVIAEVAGGLAVHQKLVVPQLESYYPIGAHVTTTVLSSEVTLVKPMQADGILLQCFTQSVRYKIRPIGSTDDASGSTGFVLAAADGIVLLPLPDNHELSVFEDAASASLESQFVRIGARTG